VVVVEPASRSSFSLAVVSGLVFRRISSIR
jgi:hypothetical protein